MFDKKQENKVVFTTIIIFGEKALLAAIFFFGVALVIAFLMVPLR